MKEKWTTVKLKTNDWYKNNRQALMIGGWTLAAMATAIAVLQNSGIRNLNQFLRENDMFDLYYREEQLAEKAQ